MFVVRPQLASGHSLYPSRWADAGGTCAPGKPSLCMRVDCSPRQHFCVLLFGIVSICQRLLMKPQTRSMWFLTGTQMSFPRPFAEAPCWCQLWGSRGHVSSGWQGPSRNLGKWVGAGLLREPILAAQPDGVGTVEGLGRLWAMVRVLPLALQTLRAAGGGPAASPCWAALPLTHLSDSVAAIHLEGAPAPRLLHTETRVASPSLVCEVFGGPCALTSSSSSPHPRIWKT